MITRQVKVGKLALLFLSYSNSIEWKEGKIVFYVFCEFYLKNVTEINVRMYYIFLGKQTKSILSGILRKSTR